MTVTAASFRTAFPEFADTSKYPDASITFWITAAVSLQDPGRWGNLIDLGTQLFVAHNVVLQARNVKTSSVGGFPGQATGPVSAKSVDKVSENFDTQSAAEADGGHYNLTTYGQQYLRLARMVGAGPQIFGYEGSGGSLATDPDSTASAWAGVVY